MQGVWTSWLSCRFSLSWCFLHVQVIDLPTHPPPTTSLSVSLSLSLSLSLSVSLSLSHPVPSFSTRIPFSDPANAFSSDGGLKNVLILYQYVYTIHIPFPFRSFLPIHGVLSSCTNLLLCYQTVFIAYLYLVCVYHPVYFVYSINLVFFHLSVSSFVLQCGGSHTLDCINSIFLSLYFTFCQ